MISFWFARDHYLKRRQNLFQVDSSFDLLIFPAASFDLTGIEWFASQPLNYSCILVKNFEIFSKIFINISSFSTMLHISTEALVLLHCIYFSGFEVQFSTSCSRVLNNENGHSCHLHIQAPTFLKAH